MSPCDTCAFKEGSITHDREPYNRLRGLICALAGIPFACHHGLDHARSIHVMKGKSFDLAGNVTKARICAGWKSEIARLKREGHFPDDSSQRKDQQIFGNYALGLVEMFIAEGASEETKQDCQAEIMATLRILTGGDA